MRLNHLRTVDDVCAGTACSLDVFGDFNRSKLKSEAEFRVAGCSTVYIALGSFLSFSAAYDLKLELESKFANQFIVFVGSDICDGVIRELRTVPRSRFLEFPRRPRSAR